ncbi:MAG: hypothetical protein AAGA48_21680 [Myxococcota bacterium]
MSSTFLLGFSQAVVDQLRARTWVELREGSADRVVSYIAQRLSESREGSSLISTLERALLACPDVEELYADLDSLKDLVDELG